MPRKKTNKEYAIKINHPKLGDWYLNYIKFKYVKYQPTYDYIFTQDLSKVNTWKVEKVIKQKIQDINKYSKNNNILLALKYKVSDFEMSQDKNYLRSMGKYYYKINFVESLDIINEAFLNIKELDEKLLNDSLLLSKVIEDKKQISKDFDNFLTNFEKNIKKYKKYNVVLQKYNQKYNNNNIATISIIDASYNFRGLKLKNLKNVQNI